MKRKLNIKNNIKKIKFMKEENDDLLSIGNKVKKNKPSNDSNKKTKHFKSKMTIRPDSENGLNDLMKLESVGSDSNHFIEMQILELLNKRSLSNQIRKSLKSFLRNLKSILKTYIPKSEDLDKLVCPINDLNESFIYQPSSIIKFSYPLQTILLDEISYVYIQIEIPKNCIHSKDYLNEGYMRRRSQYLKYILAILNNIPKLCDIKYLIYFHANKPTISFSTIKFKKFKIEFIVETTINDVFKVGRFTSNTNSIRKKYYGETYKFALPDVKDNLILNPHYDSSILTDMLISKQRNYYKESLKDINIYFDSIILIKLWFSKRNINLCLQEDVIISFIIYLSEKNLINEQMSRFEIFKIFITCIATSNWEDEGVYFNNLVSMDLLPFEYFKNQFHITFTDKSGYLNLCYDWTIYQYKSLRNEASLTVGIINSEAIDKFRQIFLDKITFNKKYDYIFQVNTSLIKEIITQSINLAPKLMDFCGDYIKIAKFKICEILEKGLDKRILTINFKIDKYYFSPTIEANYFHDKFITFGLLVDKTHACLTEERGPVANSKEAIEFLKFWGEISEQYLHPGEHVREIIKWKCNNFLEKRLIIMKIIKHLLHRHLSIPKKDLIFYGQQFDSMLQSCSSMCNKLKQSLGSGEEIHGDVIRLVDSLSKILRSIPDLPLPINSILNLSPIFRYTEVIPYPTTAHAYMKTSLIGNCVIPLFNASPQFTPFYEVVCMLEGSGKWPDDKEAIKRLKSAFYIKLAPSLKTNNYSIKVHTTFIDAIPLNTSVIFRIRVGFLQEIAFSKKTILNDGKVMMLENEESRRLEMRLIILPKLTSTLHGLNQQSNIFGYICRLCKRWLSAQLLCGQFNPEVIELMVAYLYVTPRSQSTPFSQLSGFIQFLNLISNFDWNLQPLIVNLNNKFTQEDIQDIEQHFNENAESGQSMYISYPDDKYSKRWTILKPSKLALRRLIVLAKATLDTIENLINNQLRSMDDFKKMFRPPLEDFNFIINLKIELCPRYSESIDYDPTKQKGLDKTYFNCENLYPIVDFDPIQKYVSDLETYLGEFISLFYDMHGGTIIAGIWNKASYKPKVFDEELLEFRKLSDKKSEEGLLIPCKEKIINKIKLLGNGIIDKISLLN